MKHDNNFLQALALIICMLCMLPQSSAQVNFSLNAYSSSHLYWPFADGSYATKGYNSWWVSCSSNCGLHQGDDEYADDWYFKNALSTCGKDFLAPLSGTVIYAGENTAFAPYGKQVVIQSDVNTNFAFRVAHLKSISVALDSYVAAGTKLGEVGETGTSGGCHGHLVLYKNINQSNGITTGLDYLKSGYSPTGTVPANAPPTQFAASYFCDASPPNCPPLLYLTGTISSDTYDAESHIVAKGNIFYNNHVRFNAGQIVSLQPGFVVHKDASLSVYIQPCQTAREANPLLINQHEESAITSYPNPFTDQTTIRYRLANSQAISIYLLNSMGQRVQTLLSSQYQTAGEHELDLNADRLSPGIYICQLIRDGRSETHKIMLSR